MHDLRGLDLALQCAAPQQQQLAKIVYAAVCVQCSVLLTRLTSTVSSLLIRSLASADTLLQYSG
jgi:hypothetical protein